MRNLDRRRARTSASAFQVVEDLEQRRLLTVSGVVFNDANANGTLDTGETGFANRVVYVDLNNNGTFDNGEPSTTTGSGGAFSFSPSASGVLRTVLPSAYYSTGTSTTVQSSGNSTVNLGQTLGMVVSGKMFVDVNSNGVYDNGDTALAGVVVYEDLNSNGAYDAGEPTTSSAGDGTYSLTIQPLPFFSPSISVKPVAGYLAEETGTAFGFSQGYTLTYNVGFSGQSYVSGYVQQILSNGVYEQYNGATVYADLNNDGVLDSGDISQVAGNSTFQIGGLPQGNLTVRVVVPSGYSLYNASSGSAQITVGSLTASKVYFYLKQSTVVPATISGTVYTDVNGNGVIDSGDTGLSGATVYVDANNDGIFENTEQFTTTSSTGQYQLSESVLGAYTVRVVAPSGSSQTLPAGGAAYSVSVSTSGQAITGENFAVTSSGAGGTISGVVFTDYNASGSLIPSNYAPGIAGVTVFDDLNGNGVVDSNEPYTVSASNGAYTLNGLPAGIQTLRIVTPAGYFATDPNAGKQLLTAPASAVDFPLFKDMEFNGIVFADTNGNGQQDVSETGQAGVRIFIDENHDGFEDAGDPSITTDSSGLYDFSNITPSPGQTQYNVYFIPANGYISQIVAYGVGYFSGDVTTNRVAQDSQSYVQGYVQAFNGNNDSGLAGLTVYADLNQDGTFDAGDVSTTTDPSGAYQLGNLPVGNVNISLILPAGYSMYTGSSTQSVLISAQSRHSVRFNVSSSGITTSSLGGTLYNDTNSNGIFDLAELPLAGQTVYIDSNNNGVLDPGEQSTTSDTTGRYVFTGLGAGNYHVRQVLSNGQTQTAPTNNAYVSGTIFASNGLLYGGTLTYLGTHAAAGRITVNVFNDLDGNGLQGAGESNLSGSQVYIDNNSDGVYDGGDTLGITNASGFTFSNLTPGSYLIGQILPSGYRQTFPTGGAEEIAVVVDATSTAVSFGTNNLNPTAVIGGTFNVGEGSTVTLNATGSTDTGGQLIKFEWDVNYDGTNFNGSTSGLTTIFDATALDGPTSRTVALRVTDSAGYTSITSQVIQILNVAPTALFSGSNATLNTPGSVSFTSAFDPSASDTAAGFTYSYDFNDDGVWDLVTTAASASVPASYLTTAGAHTVAGEIIDKDGGSTIYTAAVQVNSTSQLTGTIIGTAGSYLNDGNTSAKAFDGDLTTYFDGPTNSNDWIGLDLGAAKIITSLAYASRSGWASRMNGGIFQASNSPSFSTGVVNLYTISSNANPSSTTLTTQTITNTSAYRYVRYLGPAKSFGDVAEIQFFGKAPVVLSKFTGTTIGTSGSYKNDGNTIAKATDGSLSTYYDGAGANGNWVGLDLGSAKIVKQISFAPRSNYGSRMVGGIFQASNSANFSSGVVNLYTITSSPTSNVLTNVTVNVTAGYRYYRYLSPNGSEGDIAEVGFYG